MQDNRPVYLNPVNKKRQINFDEELLVIFFSILNFLNEKYGFTAQINCNFDLIKGKQFDAYIEKGLGRTRLLQIKYKYFSDKALELWELCYAFFDHAKHVHINTNQQEYLLAKNFNIVFEAIIDELIGDSPLPDGMDKKQEDGKIVDHLFKDRSLIENKEKFTYYIGDSKYYKIGHELGPESVYKQYTYARNVIQWNLDIFNDGRTPASGIRLRDDELTEGYNIIPNFFISAKMDNTFDYGNGDVERANKKKNQHQQVHFNNRLFDRDTLLLFHYDVNFLFVVSLYARNNALQKAGWKEKMRTIFREDIQNWLETYFNFYAMKSLPGNDTETYIKEHFRDVIGKVYTPYSDRNILSLALDKAEEYKRENEELLAELRQHFIVMPCALGMNPEEVISKELNEGSYYAKVPFKEGDYFLSAIDPKENDNIEELKNGTAKTFLSGYATLTSGINLQRIKNFAVVDGHKVKGVYRVEEVTIVNKAEKLAEARENTKEDRYQGYNSQLRVQLTLGEYSLVREFTFGIPVMYKGCLISKQEFQDYLDGKHEKKAVPT